MRFFYLCSFIIIFLTACSDDIPVPTPKLNSLEKLERHSENFAKGIYSYDNGIHVAIGYGIANSILIEGNTGNIIIDTTDDVAQAAEVLKEFQKINNNPIEAIIYTHNHGDHVFGASVFYHAQEEAPLVIAHATTAAKVNTILGKLQPIISLRSSRMFGTNLPPEDVINVGLGPFLAAGDNAPGYIAPNLTFEKELKLNIAGIQLELFHAPGETDDQIFVWLPEFNALMPGDNFYETFPNLYTLRGTSHRDVKGWIRSIDHMRSLQPTRLFPSHTMPVEGEEVMEALTVYRDGMQFIHDQTLRLMNKGFTADEIIESIQLPEELAESPYLVEFYGTVRYSIRSIFNGYLGWFSGNPADLDPLTISQKAEKISVLAGGDEALFNELQNAYNNKEMQWVLELADLLLAREFNVSQVQYIKFDAIAYLGIRESNPPRRNYLLSMAHEFESGRPYTSLTERSPDILSQMPLETFLEILTIRMNPEKFLGKKLKVCLGFDSGKQFNLYLRNSILEVNTIDSDQSSCDIAMESSEQIFKEVLAGIRNPIVSIAAGDIVVSEGSNVEFLSFLADFRD